ncbi:MAG: hypothetical protein AAB795_02410, partial [Patescibacteria group bacterium]
SFATKIIHLLAGRWKSNQHIEEVLQSGILLDLFEIERPFEIDRHALRRALKLPPLPTVIATVQYGKRRLFNKALKRLRVNPEIAHFPLLETDKKTVAFEVFAGSTEDPQEIKKEMKEAKLRPASIEELVAFVSLPLTILMPFKFRSRHMNKLPPSDKDFSFCHPIVALGSILESPNGPVAPIMTSDSDHLGIKCFNDKLGVNYCRYLAVRED